MMMINIPKPSSSSSEDHDVIDGPAELLKVNLHKYYYTNKTPNPIEVVNKKPFTILGQQWKIIYFPITIETNLPAVVVPLCEFRTLYLLNLYQHVQNENTNDTYLSILLYNKNHFPVVVPYHMLFVKCHILPQKKNKN
jgi:hypothetical protein